MQANAHELRCRGALLVHQIEGVDHVTGEIVGAAEACVAIETIVVRLQRIGDDEVPLSGDGDPVGQLVVERVTIVKEAARLDEKAARVGAGAPVEPADRRPAG